MGLQHVSHLVLEVTLWNMMITLTVEVKDIHQVQDNALQYMMPTAVEEHRSHHCSASANLATIGHEECTDGGKMTGQQN